MRIPLQLGPLAPDGHRLYRSGFRWRCEDGQLCRAGQVVAYCNVGLAPDSVSRDSIPPFASESRDLQAALVLGVDGRIRHAKGSSAGGFGDQLQSVLWEPGFVVADLDCTEPTSTAHVLPLRIMLAGGRRVTEYAEVRVGFLTGWHDRSRAWWADGSRVDGTLLSLGTCELNSAIRGRHFDYTELLTATPGAAQLILVPDDVLDPSARVMLEQVVRTPKQAEEIALDLAQGFR